MEFARSTRIAARLLYLDRIGSTNDELRGRLLKDAPSELPDFSVVVTADQTGGHGRLGRSWSTPPGTTVAVSVLLRDVGSRSFAGAEGLVPLAAGVAMTRAVRDLGVAATLKWPNDVLVEDRKLCGILCERIQDSVIIGAGLNVLFAEDQSPVPTATSLRIEGVDVDLDTALHAYLVRLREVCDEVTTHGPAAVLPAVQELCGTLGRPVRVELPGETFLNGIAVDLDDDGRLIVEADGRRTAVSAGDVTHLRY